MRVGLLGFRKEVEALREVVKGREEEVGRLVEERRGVRAGIEIGRKLVGFEEGLGELEGELEIGGKKEGDGEVEDSDEEEDEDEDEEDEAGFGVSIAKLRRNAMQYRVIKEMEKNLGAHPFVVAQAVPGG